jgi:hypothetical protein
MKYKVYVIQSVQLKTLEIEANSKEEAMAAYNERLDGLEVLSLAYRHEKIEYVVEPVTEK